jgi:hypothetical protein
MTFEPLEQRLTGAGGWYGCPSFDCDIDGDDAGEQEPHSTPRRIPGARPPWELCIRRSGVDGSGRQPEAYGDGAAERGIACQRGEPLLSRYEPTAAGVNDRLFADLPNPIAAAQTTLMLPAPKETIESARTAGSTFGPAHFVAAAPPACPVARLRHVRMDLRGRILAERAANPLSCLRYVVDCGSDGSVSFVAAAA